MPRRWLVKTEPKAYAFADLQREKRTTWEGVSNALALIHLRAMQTGDLVLVYHTGREKAVAGLARIVAGPRPPNGAASKAGGASSDRQSGKPSREVVVDLEAVAPAKTPVTLAAIRAEPKCKDLGLVRQPRLSVMPVTDQAWEVIAKAAGF